MDKSRKIKKIVLAFDSFKGSLTSMQAADAATRGIYTELPDCNVVKLTISDGGEGFTDALATAVGGNRQEITCSVTDPLCRPISAKYNILNGDTAIIETAAASGLTLLAPSERNPMITTSLGTGLMIADAINRGCRKFILGLGGSATNDAAMGILNALGYNFLDSKGYPLKPIGENLARVAEINCDDTLPALHECNFTLACDVTSPFYGPTGAAHVYAPQKGADPKQVEALDAGLQNFAKILSNRFGCDITATPGAGAAGGIGGSLLAILNAQIKHGIDIVLDYLQFDAQIADADLVITGEGAIDSQSSAGKAVCGVIARASQANVPVVALGGSVSAPDYLLGLGATAVLPIHSGPIDLATAMRPNIAAQGIASTLRQVIRLLNTML